MLYEYAELERRIASLPKFWRNIDLVRAFRCLSRLSSNDLRQEEGAYQFKFEWDAARPEAAGAIREILLQGLDGAVYMQDRAVLLLEYTGIFMSEADRLGYSPDRSLMAFRRARALRSLGRSREAMREIDTAIGSITGSGDFARTFSEQCIRERTLIQYSFELDHLRAESADTLSTVRKIEQQVDEKLQTSVIRSAEVIAIFSSAVAFAIGAGAIGSNVKTALAAVLDTLGLGVGLLGFTWLVLLVVGWPARATSPQGQRRTNRVMALSAISSVSALAIATLALAVHFISTQ